MLRAGGKKSAATSALRAGRQELSAAVVDGQRRRARPATSHVRVGAGPARAGDDRLALGGSSWTTVYVTRAPSPATISVAPQTKAAGAALSARGRARSRAAFDQRRTVYGKSARCRVVVDHDRLRRRRRPSGCGRRRRRCKGARQRAELRSRSASSRRARTLGRRRRARRPAPARSRRSRRDARHRGARRAQVELGEVVLPGRPSTAATYGIASKRATRPGARRRRRRAVAISASSDRG